MRGVYLQFFGIFVFASQVSARLGSTRQPFLLKLWKEHALAGPGEKVLADHGGGYFIGTVKMGQPEPQEMHVAFSSSTGMCVVPSSDCTEEACLAHRRYNAMASQTSIDIQENGRTVDPAGGRRAPAGMRRDTSSIGFAATNSNSTGGIEGVLVTELMCMGDRVGNAGSTEQPICANVSVVVATHMEEKTFRKGPQDGMIGLSLSALSIAPHFHFLSRLGMEGLQSHFGFYVSDDAHSAEITFGGHDQTRLESGLKWVPVAAPDLGHWFVDIVKVTVGDEDIGMCGDGKPCRGLVHTSSPKIVVPEDTSTRLIASLKGEGQAQAQNCHFPELSFHLTDGVVLKLQAEDFVGPGCKPEVITHRLGVDQSGGAGLIMLGEPVLRRYYTVFDWQKESVAFAPMRVKRSCRRLQRAGLPMPSHCVAELADL